MDSFAGAAILPVISSRISFAIEIDGFSITDDISAQVSVCRPNHPLRTVAASADLFPPRDAQ